MEKKKIIIIVCLIIIIAILIGVYVYISNMPQNEPQNVLESYISQINEKNYEGLYDLISSTSKENISKEDFINRNKNIYEGIDSANIKIEINNIEKEQNETKISYKETMNTSAGEIEFENQARFIVEDKEYKLQWSSAIIFPNLRETDRVRVSTITSERGEILDRNGNKLAENGTISSVGIVPGKLGDTEEIRNQNISEISALTGVSIDYINTQLSASWVKDDVFVPIKSLANNETELKEKLLQISGVQINQTNARVYPLGEEAGHLIGYIQSINAEELESLAEKGYTQTSIIGKSGLEAAYEDRLRGIDGVEIYIQDEQGNKLKTLAKQDKKDGEDIKLTIDSNLQKEFYEQLKEDKGFFVVMEPHTGEILALVSTPTYDSNDFVLGYTNEEWNKLNNDENKPLYNRFVQKYCPGSTFKSITAAIGISTGKVTPNTTFNYSRKKLAKRFKLGKL